MTKPILHALCVALFLGIGAACNGVSRWHPESWRMLNALDSLVGGVALVGMGIARRK
jgi:hypothetical protein